MRAGPVFCTFAVLAASLLTVPCWSQVERRVSIVPERPLAGSAFVIEVILPGEPAEAVVPLEPVLRGPARYTGADVRPGLDGEGLESAVVAYRFMAEAAGAIDIVDLSARSGKRLLQFGSWSMDAVSGSRAPTRVYGSWSAPDSVLVRELFTVTALGPDGNPVACPSFAVEGCLFEPVYGKPGSFFAVVLEPGTLHVPRLEIGDGTGRFELRPSSVVVKDLPAAATNVDAVGGPWRLELVAPESGITVAEDEVVAWELRASGPGWPGFATAPELTVKAPDGSTVSVGAGLAHSGRTGAAGGSYASLRGAFTVQGPGIYTVRPLPYVWFDTATRTVRQAAAPAVSITVTAASAPVWKLPETVVALALARMAALAANDTAWKPAYEAASRGDWTTARLEASMAAGFSGQRGALATASLRGNAAGEKAFAVAAATLAAVSIDSGNAGEPDIRDRHAAERDATALRAEAFAVFLHLERAAFPARGVTAMANATSASFGNLDRPSHVLPPYGWIFVVALVFIAVAGALSTRVAHRRRVARQGGASRAVALILAVVSAVVLGLALVSVLERAGQRFVSLGGPARAVPSALAAEGKTVDAGQTGRVLESTAEWVFVEFDEGGAVWLSAHDVAKY
jgi:hypothetical protein